MQQHMEPETGTVIVTGSSGLIGSAAVESFHARGAQVHGIDNNMRADLFGAQGDTLQNLNRLKQQCQHFVHHHLDIRDRPAILKLFEDLRPDLVIHAAAQPSHDLAAQRPFDDFDINALGTMNLLEATRRFAAQSVFIHISTNKVYGDAPNELPLVELETRWDYADESDFDGIDETCRIDRCLHSLFGASKVASDVMAQEYGRYFNMNVGVFRGGCLTGPQHAGAEQHGFLNYLFRTIATGGHYTVFGYQGKQVRDQIHCQDVIAAMYAFYQNPRQGEVYNIGGCRENSASVLECITLAEQISGQRLSWSYSDQARKGDHICYISNMSKFRSHYPRWQLEQTLPGIGEETWQAVSTHIHA